MFINVEDKKIIVRYYGENLVLPNHISEKVNAKWEEIRKENPSLWNGEIQCVSKIKINNDSIELICKKSTYAHYLYGERIGLPKEYECRNISAGVLLETKDGYFTICELDDNTSYPGVLQVPGGNIDKKDIFEYEINYLKTIIRETIEEINIDLNDKKIVKAYKVSGFYNADEGLQPGVQIFAIAKLNILKDELEEHFKKYYKYLKENNGEIEIKKLHFLNKGKCIEELEKKKKKKRTYLKGLLENSI